MKDFLSRNFIYILFGIIILLIFVSFVFIDVTQKRSPFPSPSPEADKPVQGHLYQVITPENLKDRDQSIKVAQLIKILPYAGSSFHLDYYYSSGQFGLVLYKGREQAGKDEFKQFLLDHDIPSQDWLNNLITRVY